MTDDFDPKAKIHVTLYHPTEPAPRKGVLVAIDGWSPVTIELAGKILQEAFLVFLYLGIVVEHYLPENPTILEFKGDPTASEMTALYLFPAAPTEPSDAVLERMITELVNAARRRALRVNSDKSYTVTHHVERS